MSRAGWWWKGFRGRQWHVKQYKPTVGPVIGAWRTRRAATRWRDAHLPHALVIRAYEPSFGGRILFSGCKHMEQQFRRAVHGYPTAPPVASPDMSRAVNHLRTPHAVDGSGDNA